MNILKNKDIRMKPFCFICGRTSSLVGLTLIATKQEDRKFRNVIYYQVCHACIPKLIKFLSSKRGLAYFDLWREWEEEE